MACRHHPPTGAQAAALAADGPALIVQHTTGSQVARSNGFPIWYDPTGRDHVAHAYTWRHPRRRYPDTFWPEHGATYLPLHDTRGDRPPVIDVLRAGRHLDRGWAAVDIAPARPLLDPTAVELLDHRDDLLPTGAAWHPGMVRFGPEHTPAYPALVADGYTTPDGGLLARFDRRTAARMATDADQPTHGDLMPGECPVLRWRGDTLVLHEEHDGPADNDLDDVDTYRPDHDGLYSVGAYLLMWRPAADTTMPPPDRIRLLLRAATGRLRQRH